MTSLQDADALPVQGRWRRRWLAIAGVVTLLLLIVGWFVSRGATPFEQVAARALRAERAVVRPPTGTVRVRLVPRFEAPTFKSWSGILEDREALPSVVDAVLERYGHRTEPLRVESYWAWRATLAQRQDVLIEEPGRLTLRTLTDKNGALRGVEVVLNADTFGVFAVRLLGSDYRVELTLDLPLPTSRQ